MTRLWRFFVQETKVSKVRLLVSVTIAGVANALLMVTINAAAQVAASPGPRIVYFRIKVKPSCPSNGSPAYFPGNPTTLEWEVTGGPTGVSIYLDGGLFSSYPIKDTQEIPFACEGPSNSQKKHTYLLKTVGGGPVQQMSVVAEAHIN